MKSDYKVKSEFYLDEDYSNKLNTKMPKETYKK